MRTPKPWMPLATLVAVVVVLALLPLVGERSFYYWDDTAAVFVPTWRAIGLDLWAGRWPTLRPDLWMGGNWAAEAQFGLWSPANLLAALVISQIPHLGLAATLAKLGAMLLLAVGAYLLFREYGADRWAAAGVASALPFAGYTLYFDAATWVAGLLAYAWTPWFWVVARRLLHGRGGSLPVYIVGFLAVTNGNPYGVVGVLVVLAGLAVEAVATRRWAGLGRLVLVGACVGTAAGVAYLPMAGTATSGWRGEAGGITNNNELVPSLSMLAGGSTPSQLPLLDIWTQLGSSVPATYLAWFLLPVVPWLAWGALRGRAGEFAAVTVFGVVFLLLALGPSQIWLFRWPVRLVQYAFLAACVPVAVALGAGLRTDGWRTRASLSCGLVLFGAWLAFSARPDLAARHGVGLLVVGALVLLLVAAAHRGHAAVAGVLMAGTGVVLALQVAWVPANLDVMVWRAPTRLASFEQYAATHPGPVVQLAAGDLVPEPERTAAASELLFGSQAAIAGVESTTSYTGIGFDAFSRTLCLNHAGNACVDAFGVLWRPAGDAVRTPLILDAVKARTVVVQNALVPDAAAFDPPAGWRRARVTQLVTVFERTGDLPWPGSRLAAVSGDVTVVSASSTDTSESVVVRTGADVGALQFARLAWPGYTATLDGRPVEVARNGQGLIEISVPPGVQEGVLALDFWPPGYDVGIPLLLAGAAMALALAVADATRGRRTARPRPRYAEPPAR